MEYPFFLGGGILTLEGNKSTKNLLTKQHSAGTFFPYTWGTLPKNFMVVIDILINHTEPGSQCYIPQALYYHLQTLAPVTLGIE